MVQVYLREWLLKIAILWLTIWCLKMVCLWLSRRPWKFQKWRNTPGRRSRTDLESMTKMVSIFFQAATSSIRRVTTLTRKAMTSSEATIMRRLGSTFQRKSTPIWPCKSIWAITQATIAAQTRSTVSADLTMVCRKIILNFDATMEASMLNRTTQASMVSSIQTSSPRRDNGRSKTPMDREMVDSKTTLSRTSTEG